MFAHLLDSAREVLTKASSELAVPPDSQHAERTSVPTKQEGCDSTQATGINQEDIAKLSQGIDALVSFISERIATNEVDEEKLIKVDSSEGKVQLPTTVGDHPTAERAKHEKADILSELMSEAKKLRNAVDERKLQDQKASNTDGTTQSNQSLSREDVTKMMARIGSLIDSLTKKPDDHRDDDPAAGSHRTGQPMQDATTGGDFLSGLMSIASDLSKAVGERNPDVQSTNTNAPKTNESAQGSQQFNQQDIEKLTAGIGSLVGTIRDKASDIFHKPVAGQEQKELKEKPEEKSEEKPEEQPVIDDVEGEIGKVVLTGYTSANTLPPSVTTSKKNQ